MISVAELFGTGSADNERGISDAKGVCTCDEIGKCTCETKINTYKKKTENKTNFSTPILSMVISIKNNKKIT